MDQQNVVWAQRGNVQFTIANDIICFVQRVEDGWYHASYIMPVSNQYGSLSTERFYVNRYETEDEAKRGIIAVAEIPF